MRELPEPDKETVQNLQRTLYLLIKDHVFPPRIRNKA